MITEKVSGLLSRVIVEVEYLLVRFLVLVIYRRVPVYQYLGHNFRQREDWSCDGEEQKWPVRVFTKF